MSFFGKIFGVKEAPKAIRPIPTPPPQPSRIPTTPQLPTIEEARPLFAAALSGDAEMAQALLKGKPSLVFARDDERMTALHMAAVKGHREVTELLLVNKADVNARSKGLTPLHFAANGNNRDVIELLLANHA